MKRLLTVILFALVPVAAVAARPVLYGFAPAYPADSLPRFEPPGGAPYTPVMRLVTMVLTVADDGTVDSVQAASELDSLFANYMRAYLSKLSFVPAEFDGEAVRSQLPVVAEFRPGDRFPRLHLPIDVDGSVTDRDRYFDIFAYNDIALPELVRFPSYFIETHRSDTANYYPYVLLKVSLDSTGTVLGVNTVLSTLKSSAMTTASAALWGEYRPLSVHGRQRASDCFLLVSYFVQVSYPTRPFSQAAADSAEPLAAHRVALMADTVGLLNKPIPRRMPGNRFVWSDFGSIAAGVMTAGVSIDTAGRARVTSIAGGTPELGRQLRQDMGRLPFFPARDFSGRPYRYHGIVRLTFSSSAEVRIDYLW